jgi:ribosomal protein L18E
MQITSAKKEELALLIHGLRSMCVVSQIDLQKRLLEQLEQELSTRYGVKVSKELA